MESIVTTEHGIVTTAEPTPEGWVDVLSHAPSSSITPWDSYGRREQRIIGRVLAAAGIECVERVTHRRILHPRGTGPGGRVRFGDDMLPGVYRVAVKAGDAVAALAAIDAHREAVRRWLDDGEPMPEACRW